MPRVLTGLDRLPDHAPRLRARRVGLLAHAASHNREFRHAIDVVAELGNLRALFGPEHGLRGAAAAGDQIGDATDPGTGTPVFSLYGDRKEPTAEQLALIELLVVDLQDVGVRFFTYYLTLAHCLRACAMAGKGVLVLDRPNPLGGLRVDGPRLSPELGSFVGLAGLPIQHGMTFGELARWIVACEHLDVELDIVQLNGWRREITFADSGLLWTPPSPNIPTLDTVRVYPGTCLVEGTIASEGRGTTRPFEQVGAPDVAAEQLAAAMSAPGAVFQPTCFTPTASKHAGRVCGGVMVRPVKRRFRPLRAGLELLVTARHLEPEAFAWRPPDDQGVYWIDRLAGPGVRDALDSGVSAGEIVDSWKPQRKEWRRERRPFLLY